MVETLTSEYEARIERDESGIWVGTVPALRGVVTQARTLARLRENLREAVALWLEVDLLDQGVQNPKVDPRTVSIVAGEIVLPFDLLEAREAAQRLRLEAAEAEAQAQAAMLAAIEALRAAGLSQRDTAEMLGLSHQRIAQLLDRARRPGIHTESDQHVPPGVEPARPIGDI